MKVRVAVDAMGGDYAPLVVVKGAELAVKEDSSIEVLLVGREEEIKRYLGKGKRIEIIPAREIIEMEEPPALSVRKKSDSSINRGIKLLKDGGAEVFLSAGNTGAVVTSATLFLKTIPGVERPGIAIIFPTVRGFCLLIDAGANIDPKPEHLLDYGIMGAAYAELILDKENPTVGLLNIGEEETKGPEFLRETLRLLKDSQLNFTGNIEGRDIFLGKCDVIVADGFVGNVALKVSESVAIAGGYLLKKHIKTGLLSKLGGLLLKPSLNRLRKELDYTEYGGAPLLGVNGNVIICHGSSSAKAIKNAIKVAKDVVNKKVNERIKQRLELKVKR